MRMVHYFGIVAALAVPALIATVLTGVSGARVHLTVGLLTAMLTVALHTLLIVFMIITGRVLREAVRARHLEATFLVELNDFFAKKKIYPVSILAAFAIVVAAVLGYGNRGFGLPSAVHMLVGLTALLVTLWAIPIEIRTLMENQRLLDRVATELDRLDREQGPRLSDEEFAVSEGYDPRRMSAWTLNFALGAWLPYLYQALIVWRGDFGRVSLHPWIELSLVGFALWFLAKREESRTA